MRTSPRPIPEGHYRRAGCPGRRVACHVRIGGSVPASGGSAVMSVIGAIVTATALCIGVGRLFLMKRRASGSDGGDCRRDGCAPAGRPRRRHGGLTSGPPERCHVAAETRAVPRQARRPSTQDRRPPFVLPSNVSVVALERFQAVPSSDPLLPRTGPLAEKVANAWPADLARAPFSGACSTKTDAGPGPSCPS